MNGGKCLKCRKGGEIEENDDDNRFGQRANHSLQVQRSIKWSLSLWRIRIKGFAGFMLLLILNLLDPKQWSFVKYFPGDMNSV